MSFYNQKTDILKELAVMCS